MRHIVFDKNLIRILQRIQKQINRLTFMNSLNGNETTRSRKTKVSASDNISRKKQGK